VDVSSALAHSRAADGRMDRRALAVGGGAARREMAMKKGKAQPCNKRVLVIEDDMQQAEAIKGALELSGCSIDVALTGTEGVEKARGLRPDIIFCDIRLPDIDGFEVARRIRADPDLQSVRLLALSAYPFPEHRKESERAGFEAHLVKPPSFDELETWIATAPKT
jgi:CheY-like chemotaxis protein